MQTIAGIVASRSKRIVRREMSSDTDQSFDEKTKAYKKQKIEHLDPTDPEDAFQYHQGKILQEADDVSESGPFYLTASEKERVGAVAGLFVLGFLGSAVMMPVVTIGMATLYGMMLGGIGFLFFTRFGVAMRRSFNSITTDSQQQVESSSEPKRICSNCGWQNPTENTYCHDCGEELGRDR
jgi:ribosomal protein L40E